MKCFVSRNLPRQLWKLEGRKKIQAPSEIFLEGPFLEGFSLPSLCRGNVSPERVSASGKARVLRCSVMSDSCNPWDCSLTSSSVHGILQGRNTGVGCHALLHQEARIGYSSAGRPLPIIPGGWTQAGCRDLGHLSRPKGPKTPRLGAGGPKNE